MVTTFCVFLMTILTLSSSLLASNMRSTLYRRRENLRLQTAQENLLCGDGFCGLGGRKECVFACSVHDQCGSVNFRSSDGQCVRIPTHVLQWGERMVADDAWENYSPHDTDVRDGDWILVFRAQTNLTVDKTLNGELMTTWNDNATHSDNSLHSLSPDCFSATHGNCSTFYRSRWMDTWPSDEVDEVRLSLYTAGVPVVEMVFNGTGSTRDDWFSHDRLLTSPWTDLAGASPLHFSVWGERYRRFYVSMTDFNDCTNHLGWLMVLEPGVRCRFDSDSTQVETPTWELYYYTPQFLYAKGTSQTSFNDGIYGMAEVMGIFIKLK